MVKDRKSNFELMKIVSMLMIISWHFLVHGEIIQNSLGKTNVFLTIIMCFLVVHINSFILITGYFQYNKVFKLSKAIQINNAVWFYKVLITSIFMVASLVVLSKVQIFKTLTPINYYDYWFIATYTFLYLASPLLNIIISNTNKLQHRIILFGFFLIVSVLSTITDQTAFGSAYGCSLANFIMLYFIGAYISKYDFNIFKNKSKNTRLFALISIFILLGLINYFTNSYLVKTLSNIGHMTYFVE